ncbi:hypothetical protein F5Y10DRAFT_228347 [Nemania abortiva]|nr:hypothetical protein F5Y10DRAFT_228347 [Nemania abortiva]
MTLADSAIVGIVALLIMCIPRIIRLFKFLCFALNSRRKRPLSRNTVLPLANRPSPAFGPLDAAYMDPYVASSSPIGMTHQVICPWALPSSRTPGCQGLVSLTVDALG